MRAPATQKNPTQALFEMEQAIAEVEATVEQDDAALRSEENRLGSQSAQLAKFVEQFRAESFSVPAAWTAAVAPLAPRDTEVQELADRADEARREALQLREAAVQALRAELETRREAIASREAAIASALAKAAEKLELARALRASEGSRPAPPELEVAPLKRVAPSLRVEKRAQERVRFEARVDLDTDDNFYTGFSSDISEGGIFVGTARLLPVGSHVELSFRIGDGMPLHLGGTVQWVRDVLDDPRVMPGMGVRFEGLPEQARNQIHQFMSAREPLFFA